MNKPESILQNQAKLRELKEAEMRSQGMSRDEQLKALRIKPRRTLKKNHA